MEQIIHRDFALSTKATDTKKREAKVVASTEAFDAYNEIVAQDWDLTRYRMNPVVLYGHNSYGLPIGSARDVEVEDSKLRATLSFVDASANPVAEQVWQGIQQGSIRGISVGFRSRAATTRKVGDRDVHVLSGNELIEISVVPIPANPEAVIERAKSLAVIRSLAGLAPIGDQRQAPAMPAKAFHELSSLEKHALLLEDPAAYRRLRATPETWNGKGWDDLDTDEMAALYRADRAKYLRMRDHEKMVAAAESAGWPGGVRIVESEVA